MKWQSSEKPNVKIKAPDSVSCDFTDQLEELSVRGYHVQVSYGPMNHPPKHCTGTVQDFVTKEKVEYMVMSDGTHIRLAEIRFIESAS